MNYRDMTKAKDTSNRVNRGGNYNNANVNYQTCLIIRPTTTAT